MKLVLVSLAASTLLVLAVPALAQEPCEPSWVPTFGGIPGMTDTRALTVFDDGSGSALYVGGSATSAGGVAVNGIGRWDGTSWSALGSGTNATVEALAVFDTGSGPALHAGGTFTTAGGAPASKIAKWDGASWSALGSGTNGTVMALAVFDDGSGPAIYAAGTFATAGGVSVNRIARWNGSSWSALAAGFDWGTVFALTVYDDGGGPALYAGGSFESSGGVPLSRVAKWDGTSWSALGSGIGGPFYVRALTVFDDGEGEELYVGGAFETAGGEEANGMAKWNGSDWQAVGSAGVEALTVFDDGSGPALYAGGSFLTPEGDAFVDRVARWSGSSWVAVGTEMTGDIRALASFDDGNGPVLYAGGPFNRSGNVDLSGTARWNGSTWAPLGDGLSRSVFAVSVYDDSSGPALHAAGDFHSIGDMPANRIAKWNGSGWSALGSGMDEHVWTLAVFDDGSGPALYAGGDFTTAGTTPASRIARWDGGSWSPLGSGVSNGTVLALAVFDDGSGPALYAGGSFATAGGVTVNRIARWNGASWSALSGGVSPLGTYVRALAVHDDGSGPALYVGGDFDTAGGIASTTAIARWDGATWTSVGGGLSERVFSLAVFDDGGGPKLFAGGRVTDVGLMPVKGIVAWDGAYWSAPGGGLDNPFSGPYPTADALTVFDDGSGPALYAAGNFREAGGAPARGIARWDGAGWSALGSGLNSGAYDLVAHDDGSGLSLFVAGSRSLDSGDSFLSRVGGCPDSVPPTITHPAAVYVGERLEGAPGETVVFSVTADDNLDPAPDVVCVPPSGSFFPQGTTLVTCTATDDEGNETVAEFTVNVHPRWRKLGR